ncbi:MAG: MarC family protein [Ketobacter sp.]|nr:MarC family protein [Ketobacter sp.]
MSSVAIPALTTFFAIIGPLDVAVLFVAMTVDQTAKQKRSMAIRGTLIGGVVLVIFALIGETLLTGLGISLAALRAAGGILLLLMGIDMVFARSSGAVSTTDDEEQEAISKADISVFPLATPLIAGPGAMGAAILLMADQADNTTGQAVVIGSLLTILLFTLISLLLASKIQNLLGVTGMHVITRVMGVLLCALAVQFVFDGIGKSGLFGIQ